VCDDQNDLALVLFEDVFKYRLGIAGIVAIDLQVQCIRERPRRLLRSPGWRCVNRINAGDDIRVNQLPRQLCDPALTRLAQTGIVRGALRFFSMAYELSSFSAWVT
jgi:hypothetical protein